jgi:SAM-dependent methyltransferase
MSKDIHNYFFGGNPGMPWHLKRDYTYLEGYLDELSQDVYPQPPDDLHTQEAVVIIDKWIPEISPRDVLDVGCGEGFCQEHFESYGVIYKGIALGEDVEKAREEGRNVHEGDFHFIDTYADVWDLVFARHALEHSPMPILALMEWHRVTRFGGHLILVLPKPQFWLFVGRNHYSVVTMSQARFLLDRSGWKILEEDHEHEWEYRFLCEKVERKFSPDTEYLWTYEDDDISWLKIVEPTSEKEEELV